MPGEGDLHTDNDSKSNNDSETKNTGEENDKSTEENSSLDRDKVRGEKDFGLGGDRYVKELEKMLKDSEEWGKDLKDKSQSASSGRGSIYDWERLKNEFNYLNKDRAFGITKSNDWIKMSSFVESKGFQVTFATAGTHNPGSVHGIGKAVDVRTWDHSKKEVDEFIKEAKDEGLNVRDERERPTNQAVWDAPHVHLSTQDQSPFHLKKDFK